MLQFNHELRLRILSSAVLLPVALASIIAGEMWFAALILAGAVLMSFEWNQLITARGHIPEKRWHFVGIAYVGAPCLALLYLREQGLPITLWLFAVIWSLDIGAYFTGKTFGGPKLAPQISPGKTWTGLAGGVLASMVVGGFISVFTGGNSVEMTILASILSVIAQCGDLFESWVKRVFGVKDSGNLIPGHGGILDRVDGLVPTAPLLALYNLMFGPLL
ncbi:MAG: CDP-archaeol synthase [Alphaproteobacteria bacterium]|nr:CDP-archaeol synthase [Alphaproteobacteria bacterium]